MVGDVEPRLRGNGVSSECSSFYCLPPIASHPVAINSDRLPWSTTERTVVSRLSDRKRGAYQNNTLSDLWIAKFKSYLKAKWNGGSVTERKEGDRPREIVHRERNACADIIQIAGRRLPRLPKQFCDILGIHWTANNMTIGLPINKRLTDNRAARSDCSPERRRTPSALGSRQSDTERLTQCSIRPSVLSISGD